MSKTNHHRNVEIKHGHDIQNKVIKQNTVKTNQRHNTKYNHRNNTETKQRHKVETTQ